jgi:3-hydroxypropanoate dehydrogenase
VPVELLKEVYELCPAGSHQRELIAGSFRFLTTPEAKERLIPAWAPGHVDKTRTAPVAVLVAWDTEFLRETSGAISCAGYAIGICGNPVIIHETLSATVHLQAAT